MPEKSTQNKSRTKQQAETLLDLMWWVIHEGQELAKPMHYAPLPNEAVAKAEVLLRSVLFNGTMIRK